VVISNCSVIYPE